MEPENLLAAVSETILENGLKVICLKKNGAPIISAQIWYKTGSANEHDGIRGISHFFEHMMFRGSKNFGPEEHARRINDVGGHCNAFTAEDVTAYLNSVPAEYLDMVLALEADRMRSLAITQEILDTERNVIIEEFQGNMNQPLTKALLEFRTVFYKNHPYSISPLGTLDDIKSITVDNCLEYYRTWYTPGNAVAVIVGDFKSGNEVMDSVIKTLGAIPNNQAGAPTDKEAPATVSHEKTWLRRRVEFDVPFLLVGYPAPASSNIDALRLEILQLIISQGETSRMHREIVRRRSAAVMVGGINQCLKWSGMSLFLAVFTPDVSVQRVENAIVEQIESVKDHGVTTQEMEKVKNSTLTNRVFELYSADQICQRLGYSETVEGDFRLWVKRLDALEGLDKEVLIDTARKFWNEPSRYTLYLQPKKIKPLYYFAGMFRRVFAKKN
ncbi:MAG: pitrilysin family protein [Chitinivibrionales bacterium]